MGYEAITFSEYVHQKPRLHVMKISLNCFKVRYLLSLCESVLTAIGTSNI